MRSSRAWKVPSFTHLLVGYLKMKQEKSKMYICDKCTNKIWHGLKGWVQMLLGGVGGLSFNVRQQNL